MKSREAGRRCDLLVDEYSFLIIARDRLPR